MDTDAKHHSYRRDRYTVNFLHRCRAMDSLPASTTLGSMGLASQSYLRAGTGVLLGITFLGETFTLPVAFGLGAAVVGVALINWPSRPRVKV